MIRTFLFFGKEVRYKQISPEEWISDTYKGKQVIPFLAQQVEPMKDCLHYLFLEFCSQSETLILANAHAHCHNLLAAASLPDQRSDRRAASTSHTNRSWRAK
jgi:hypothetical protein